MNDVNEVKAGNGLFAKVDFKKGELITKYDGKHLDDQYAAARCSIQTHLIAHNPIRQRGTNGMRMTYSECGMCVLFSLHDPTPQLFHPPSLTSIRLKAYI